MKQLLIGFACSIIFLSTIAQKTPEFPKGWVMYLEEYHGVSTNFTVSPDLFISGLRLVPQVTIVPGVRIDSFIASLPPAERPVA